MKNLELIQSGDDAELKHLDIDSITVDAGIQIRVKLVPAKIAHYRIRMKAGDAFPPVEVVFDGKQYILADGYYRLAAAKNLGRSTIPALVRRGDLKLAATIALKAHAHEPYRRTNADKQNAVRIAVAHFGVLSLRKMADLCGVSHQTVSNFYRCQNLTPIEEKKRKATAKPRKSKSATDTKKVAASQVAREESIVFRAPVEALPLHRELSRLLEDIRQLVCADLRLLADAARDRTPIPSDRLAAIHQRYETLARFFHTHSSGAKTVAA
jgi:hypothetical protein